MQKIENGKKLVTISQATVGKCYDNFVEVFHKGQDCMGLRMWNFLRCEYPKHDPFRDLWWFEEPVAKRIQALAGPHYRTMAQVLLLQGHDPYKETESFTIEV